MNFFEIFNKVLLELNYRPVGDFEHIYKSEHKKILEGINRLNNEVLGGFQWPFLERGTILDTVEGLNIYELPFKGLIKCVYEGDKRILYTPKAEELLTGNILGDYYSTKNGSIIFPKAACDKTYNIVYYTENYAVSADGQFKPDLETATDSSVLPMPFAEHILVYGTCLKAKGNPAYPKFGFWNTMYIQALANLRQKSSQTSECEPYIELS